MKVYVLEMVSEGGSIVYGVYKTRKSAELVGLSQVGKSWPNYYITEQEIHGQQVTECEYCNEPYYSSIEMNGFNYKLEEKELNNCYLIDLAKDGKANLLLKRECDYELLTVGECRFNYCPMCGRRLTDE